MAHPNLTVLLATLLLVPFVPTVAADDGADDGDNRCRDTVTSVLENGTFDPAHLCISLQDPFDGALWFCIDLPVVDVGGLKVTGRVCPYEYLTPVTEAPAAIYFFCNEETTSFRVEVLDQDATSCVSLPNITMPVVVLEAIDMLAPQAGCSQEGEGCGLDLNVGGVLVLLESVGNFTQDPSLCISNPYMNLYAKQPCR